MPSVADYVYAGVERLSHGAHPDRALQDAEFLLMHVLGKDRAWMLAYWRDEIDTHCSIPYHAALERRRLGEPIQYITGQTEFFGLPLHVTRDVLIPRPETEHSVEKVLALAKTFFEKSGFVTGHDFSRAENTAREPWALAPAAGTPRILDVGTGSGAIAIALAAKLPHAQITATDISSAALALAKKNAALNRVQQNIRFLEGDLLAPVLHEQFEIVVSNPPYVPESDRASLSVEVRDYEPSAALFAGTDGLDVYRRLIPQALAALVPAGWLVLEIGFAQDHAIRALLENAGFTAISFTPDLQGIPRVAAARKL